VLLVWAREISPKTKVPGLVKPDRLLRNHVAQCQRRRRGTFV